MELLTAGDVEAIFKLFNFSTHGAEIFGDESDAVGFLDAEFLSVADADSAACVGSDGGEDGELVNELSSQWAADFC